MQNNKKKLYGNALLASAFLVGNAFSNQGIGQLRNKDLDRQSDISNQSYKAQLTNLENSKNNSFGDLYNTASVGNTFAGVGSNKAIGTRLLDQYNQQKNLLKSQEDEKQHSIGLQKQQNDNVFLDTLFSGAFKIFSSLI